MNQFKTEQEVFWSEDFGNDYILRNQGDTLLASNLSLFAKALARVENLRSCIEFGSNIGMNLKALKLLAPQLKFNAIEINSKAASELSKIIGQENIYNDSILNWKSNDTWDLVLIKGVLIHINPSELQNVYEKLFTASNKYILIVEYYNPSPVTVTYRGFQDRLFKRDFAGEILEKFAKLKLLDYGFVYKRDTNFPQDDVTWFLLEKK